MREPRSNFIETVHKLGGLVYEVGGTVRDRMLGREQKDRDLLVARLPLPKILEALRPLGEVVTVGKSFGVIKFRPRGTEEQFDIALPRKEVSTGVGHRDFDVDYDPNLPVEVDLSRRDFTINAMARDLQDDRLIDPFNGEEDLRKKILRTVSDRAFEEDPLRLMRGVQFAARFGLTVEPGTYEAMEAAAPLIRSVSGERIAEELRKLFLAEKPSQGFILMQQTGILKQVLPELEENVGVEQGNKFRDDDVFMHTMRVLDAARRDREIPLSGDLELILAALFHDVGKVRTKRFDPEKNRNTFYCHQTVGRKMFEKRAAALKLSTLGVDTGSIENLAEEHMFQPKSFFADRAIRRFINKVGPERILKLIDLRLADNRGGKYPEGIRGVLKLRKKIAEELDKKTPLSVRDLAVGGRDLMALGIPEGPQLGRILKELLEVVLDEPEKNETETLLKLAQEKIG